MIKYLLILPFRQVAQSKSFSCVLRSILNPIPNLSRHGRDYTDTPRLRYVPKEHISPTLPLPGHGSLILDRDFDGRYPYKRECVGHWWPSWTSNPVVLAKTRYGGFDSHALPPMKQKSPGLGRAFSSRASAIASCQPKPWRRLMATVDPLCTLHFALCTLHRTCSVIIGAGPSP